MRQWGAGLGLALSCVACSSESGWSEERFDRPMLAHAAQSLRTSHCADLGDVTSVQSPSVREEADGSLLLLSVGEGREVVFSPRADEGGSGK